MKKTLSLLIAIVIVATVATAGVLIGVNEQKAPTPIAGSSSFLPVEGIPYTVAATVVPAATTITLSSFTTPDGRPLVMSDFGSIGYGTLDPTNLTRLESITFSGITQNTNGTATLTGVTRGNDFISPYAPNTSLAQTHLVGSTFILSNTAGFYGQQFLFANDIGSSTATISFSNTAPPIYYPSPGVQSTGSFISTTSELASVAYVNAIALAGSPNASLTVKGVVQLATGLQQAFSTATGSTGASLVTQSADATDTPQSSCASGYSAAGASCSVVAGLTGFISQAWLNLTQAFTFSTTTQYVANVGVLTATTTVSLPSATKIGGVAYTFPSVQGILGSFLENNGSGTLSWSLPFPPHYTYATSTQVISTQTTVINSTALGIPANTMQASSTITAEGTISNCSNSNSDQSTCSVSLVDTLTSTKIASCTITSAASGGATSGAFRFTVMNQSSVSSQFGLGTCIGAATTGATYQNSGTVTTATLNTAAALNLVIQIVNTGSTVNATMTLSNADIVVNP